VTLPLGPLQPRPPKSGRHVITNRRVGTKRKAPTRYQELHPREALLERMLNRYLTPARILVTIVAEDTGHVSVAASRAFHALSLLTVQSHSHTPEKNLSSAITLATIAANGRRHVPRLDATSGAWIPSVYRRAPGCRDPMCQWRDFILYAWLTVTR
jgi:hypothetical protein